MNAPPISAADLTGRIHQVEPAALLVPQRILRRVIKKHRGLGGLGLRVPHPRLYSIGRDALLSIATREELLLPTDAVLPEQILLLPESEKAILQRKPADDVLRDYWRSIFHARIDRTLSETAIDARSRIEAIGHLVFEEAREVLRQENAVFDPHDDAEVYREFAAVWLELKHFDPHRLHVYFPSADPAAVDAVLARDLDAGAILNATKLAGAAEYSTEADEDEEKPAPASPESRDDAVAGELRARADEVTRQGNQVRAAILRYRAIRTAPPTQAGALRGAARSEMERLATRLERALGFPQSQQDAWARCLRALLEPAARGFWSVEARLLYDLQKVCVDNERDIFAVDLVEFFVTWFRRPIKRLLPDQPLVLTVKNLRSAMARLPRAQMPDADRRQLRELLQESLTRAELELRGRLQPRLVAALDHVGLVPHDPAERLSRDRLVEELLDLVVQRCYLTMSDLRDAIARSRVKLPDLVNPVTFFAGDPLILLNRKLSRDLDGIYHRGEIYLRWLQRLSSLFFGNPIGRAITLYILLPLLGSFFLLKGFNILMEESHKFLGWPKLYPYAAAQGWIEEGIEPGPPKAEVHRAPETADLHLVLGMEEHYFSLTSYVVLAFFILLLLHWPGFRHVVFVGLHLVWVGLLALFHDLPAAFFRLPAVRAVLQSRVYLIFWGYVAKPITGTLPVAILLWWFTVPAEWILGVCLALAVLLAIVMNSRLGLLVQESTTDWGVRSWRLFHEDLLPGLFRAVVWIFRRFVERVDQVIYTVDEWLRFRTGEGNASFVGKVILGFVWFLITYVVRFAVNLLIEPQINPIKHFPVVTVSHKLSLLLVAPVANATGIPQGIVVFGLGLVPGIFGFLVWELKENWKLYRANGSPTVDPEMVGSHGEHVIHLIRPGFHSGTLPKLFAKLRRAHGSGFRKHEEGLHHISEGLHHFIERELIALLGSTTSWRNSASVVVGDIGLATNRIRIELNCPALSGESVQIDFANEGGLLLATVSRPAWIDQLDDEKRAAFRDALAGLYKKAGVDVVREHLATVLPAGAKVEIARDALTVWKDANRQTGAVYDPGKPEAGPRFLDGEMAVPPDARPLLFREQVLSWREWVDVWERDEAGKPHDPLALPGVEILPGVR